ncbi:hypothetical protein, partial [Bradyrhizobium ottawaense]|uniref:hypothetical protein n=1 Tax=Bradyrhizobium ottawaense TaxID=931866 RepID=UPI0030C77B99
SIAIVALVETRKRNSPRNESVDVTRRGYLSQRIKYFATILPLSRLSPCHLSHLNVDCRINI